MARYKVGLSTQQNIMQAAKELFYEKGYKETSVRDIANRANIKLGTLTYYYKKEDIVMNIYSDFSIRLYNHISQYAPQVNGSIEHIFYSTFLMYHAVFIDKQTVSFHLSINDMEPRNRYVYNQLFNRRHVAFYNAVSGISKDDWLDIGKADDILRKAFLFEYFHDVNDESLYSKESINSYCIRLMKLIGSLMRLDVDKINEYIENAKQFEELYEHDYLRLLI